MSLGHDGAPQHHSSVTTHDLSSWLIPAIVTTLCCFPLTGVVAVYFASQVNVRAELGDLAGAERAARRAKFWTLAGFLAFLALTLVGVATGALAEFVNRTTA